MMTSFKSPQFPSPIAMNNASLEILLVEDHADDAELIEELLAVGQQQHQLALPITLVKSLNSALEKLAQVNFDLILLDLSLPDSQGLNTLSEMRQKVDDIPIIILTGYNDQDLALQAIQRGAQDYLIKGTTGSQTLLRSIFYAVERQRLQDSLRQSEAQYRSVVDNLRGVVFQTDLVGNLIFISQAWTRMTGQGIREILHSPLLNLIHPQDQRLHTTQFEALILGHLSEVRYLVRYCKGEKEIGLLEVTARPTVDSAEKITGITGVLEDITTNQPFARPD